MTPPWPSKGAGTCVCGGGLTSSTGPMPMCWLSRDDGSWERQTNMLTAIWDLTGNISLWISCAKGRSADLSYLSSGKILNLLTQFHVGVFSPLWWMTAIKDTGLVFSQSTDTVLLLSSFWLFLLWYRAAAQRGLRDASCGLCWVITCGWADFIWGSGRTIIQMLHTMLSGSYTAKTSPLEKKVSFFYPIGRFP